MLHRWTAAVAATVTLLVAGHARGELSIGTLAGRQIGDGRHATTAALDRPFGVSFAPDGALLIADRKHSRIRRVDPVTGVITTRVGSISGSKNSVAADQAELQGPVTIEVDAATGDLVIADRDQHVVRRVSAANNNISRIAGFPNSAGSSGDGGNGMSALLNGPGDAVPDDAGGVLIADRNNNKIRRVAPNGKIDTVAGTGAAGYAGDDVPGGAGLAQLNSPNCVLPIASADGGGFFVCDTLNHVIRRVDGSGTITTVAGTGVAGFVDGAALTALLSRPFDLAFDADGNLLIVEEGNSTIRRLDLAAGAVSTIAGTGAVAFTPDGAPALTSSLATPRGVTLAPDGRIVFAEEGSHRVRAIDPSGNLETLAGDDMNEFGGDGGPALDAQLGQVMGVARDAAGRLLVADNGNARVRRVDGCTGLIETVAGSGARAFSGDGGPATAAGLTPYEALEDVAGNLIVADTDNHRIRIVDGSGTIDTLVGTGVAGYAGDGGPASAAQINRPWGIELDATGALYVADFDNNAVRRVVDGIITTVAGTGAQGYNGDGIPATTALLNNPSDIAIDASGNLYIADHHNHRIRRVDAATQLIDTVAGTGVSGFGGDGGPATAARLDEPMDVKVDETGAVWFTDFQNQRIRRFTVGGDIETVAGSGLRGYAGDGGVATAARLLFPFRLFLISSDQVLVSERDNFVVRALGTIPADCPPTTTTSSTSSSSTTSSSTSSTEETTSSTSTSSTSSSTESSTSTSSSSTLSSTSSTSSSSTSSSTSTSSTSSSTESSTSTSTSSTSSSTSSTTTSSTSSSTTSSSTSTSSTSSSTESSTSTSTSSTSSSTSSTSTSSTSSSTESSTSTSTSSTTSSSTSSSTTSSSTSTSSSSSSSTSSSSSSTTTFTVAASTTSTSVPAPDPGCTGMMAANCIPAGDVDAQDCFAEFRVETALQDVMPRPRFACVDGDPTCDADDVDGQCTFRVAMCFNNTDARLPCVPEPIRSVVLVGRQARSPGGRRLLQQIGSLHRTTSTSANEVVFDGFLAEANRCTPFDEFVVRRKRGGGILRAVVSTRAAGRDRNRLKLLCLGP